MLSSLIPLYLYQGHPLPPPMRLYDYVLAAQGLIKRIEAIRADVGRGLDNDTEDQAIELENLEVLEEISRIAREELNKVEQELAVLNSKS